VGAVVGVGIMLITFGTHYEDGARFVKGSCGGKWYVDAQQMERAVGDPPGK
jgi:hypothetical protein